MRREETKRIGEEVRKMTNNMKGKWRKKSVGGRSDEDDELSLPTRDDSSPIETHEQEELVRSLESYQARQSLIWRSVFAGMLFGYVVFLLYSIYQQTYFPWELRYHAYFMYEVDSWSIITADWAAVVVCLLAMKALLHESRHHRRWLWYSSCPGLFLMFFWLHHMLRLSKFRWEVLWLPLGPLSAAGICLYVDHLLDESCEEIRKLGGYMYCILTRAVRFCLDYFSLKMVARCTTIFCSPNKNKNGCLDLHVMNA